MKKSKAVSLILGISMFLGVMFIEGSSLNYFLVGQASAGNVVSAENQPSATTITNKANHHFDGTYNSVVQNTSSLNGTMVISGSSVSYSCALSGCSVQNVQMTETTIYFQLACGGTTYSFSGQYEVMPGGQKRFSGNVNWPGSAAKSASAGKSGNRTIPASKTAGPPPIAEVDTWSATSE